MSKKTLLSLIITISLIIISCESYKKESALVVKCPQLKTVYGITTLNGNKFTGSCELEEDNIVYEIKSFKKGLPHGVHKRYYYPSDKLEYIGYRKNGKIHGEYNKYHENGQIMVAGKFRNGFYRGTWKFYDDTGKLIQESHYKINGEVIESNYDKSINITKD